MFDFDKWQEIYETIRRHKLRTALTAFGVGWGIFMLVILLGAGNALQNGAEHEMRDDAVNSIWVWPGRASKPFKGLPINRPIQLTNVDHDGLKEDFELAEHTSARFYLGGEFTVVYKQETSAFSVRCVHPGHQFLENSIVTDGRYLNDIDIKEKRKVAIIGKTVKERLFKEENAVGENIIIKGVVFKVVGVYEDTGGEREMEIIYLPVTTAQLAFNGGKKNINQMMFTLGDASVAEAAEVERKLREKLAARHSFDRTDDRAVWIRNNVENFQKFQNLFTGIKAFVWLVALGSIFSGIIGVSNIMMIIVKERTREIGVRKALGATPWSIVSLILQESVVITGVAGYIGLLAGLSVLQLFNYIIDKNEIDTGFFRHPEVPFGVIVAATLILVAFGAIAGLIPSVRAAKVNPVVAMRAE
ncbi:ABC transporter permease [Limibacter armeniacum]|uniref:ABC transporter permease n=1 Tax=Limibacter armeniacum TaxID=466084 RepID=UPI002FE58D99